MSRVRDVEIHEIGSWTVLRGGGHCLGVSASPPLRIELPSTLDATDEWHELVDTALPALSSMRGETVFHTACLVDGSRAILVFGESGSGKSTAASAWVGAGGAFVGDDWCTVSLRGRSAWARRGSSVIRTRLEAPRGLDFELSQIKLQTRTKIWHWFGATPPTPARLEARVVGVLALIGDEGVAGPEGGNHSCRARILLSSLVNVRPNDPGRWRSHAAVFEVIGGLPWAFGVPRDTPAAVAKAKRLLLGG